MTRLSGKCHCGNIEVTLEVSEPPEKLGLRACSCSFCSRHGARTTSDPGGSVTVAVHDATDLIRYRFGLGLADFLICKRCGIYVAAIMTHGGRSYAVVNVNALDSPERFTQAAVSTSYEGETPDERVARRIKNWTPVASSG